MCLGGLVYRRSRDIVGGRRQPPARYPAGHCHTIHRGIFLFLCQSQPIQNVGDNGEVPAQHELQLPMAPLDGVGSLLLLPLEMARWIQATLVWGS